MITGEQKKLGIDSEDVLKKNKKEKDNNKKIIRKNNIWLYILPIIQVINLGISSYLNTSAGLTMFLIVMTLITLCYSVNGIQEGYDTIEQEQTDYNMLLILRYARSEYPERNTGDTTIKVSFIEYDSKNKKHTYKLEVNEQKYDLEINKDEVNLIT